MYLIRKTYSFEGWFWFKFKHWGLVLGMALKFYIIVAKGSILKVRNFGGLISKFGEFIGGKTDNGGLFAPPVIWIGLMFSELALISSNPVASKEKKKCISILEAYSEPCQTSKRACFTKPVNCFHKKLHPRCFTGLWMHLCIIFNLHAYTYCFRYIWKDTVHCCSIGETKINLDYERIDIHVIITAILFFLEAAWLMSQPHKLLIFLNPIQDEGEGGKGPKRPPY